MTLGITTLSIMALVTDGCYAECHKQTQYAECRGTLYYGINLSRLDAYICMHTHTFIDTHIHTYYNVYLGT